MTNIRQICDKVQEPLELKPSYWVLYNLLIRKHSDEQVSRIMSLVSLADQLDNEYGQTSNTRVLDQRSEVEMHINSLIYDIDSSEVKEAA